MMHTRIGHLTKTKDEHVCHDVSLKLGLASLVSTIYDHICLPLSPEVARTHVILSRHQVYLDFDL